MSDNLPRHIAMIMDGNRRWEEQRRLPALAGHRAGVKSIRSIVKYLGNRGLKYLTVYGFSTENWSRGPDEVQGLFSLFTEVLNKDTLELNERNVRLRHLGRLDEIPSEAQMAIKNSVGLTSDNTGMTLNFAVNYGGRVELMDAVRRITEDGISPEMVNQELFGRYLYTDGLPYVDLVIRTGGDCRLSNFMIWQAAYSELYFTDVLWPDFTIPELEKALAAYSNRCRRYGGD